jgi:hypothetical protein
LQDQKTLSGFFVLTQQINGKSIRLSENDWTNASCFSEILSFFTPKIDGFPVPESLEREQGAPIGL